MPCDSLRIKSIYLNDSQGNELRVSNEGCSEVAGKQNQHMPNTGIAHSNLSINQVPSTHLVCLMGCMPCNHLHFASIR